MHCQRRQSLARIAEHELVVVETQIGEVGVVSLTTDLLVTMLLRQVWMGAGASRQARLAGNPVEDPKEAEVEGVERGKKLLKGLEMLPVGRK